MTFKQIGTVALDGVSAELQARYGWHTGSGGSDERAPRPVAPQAGREGPLRMETGKGRGNAPRQVHREENKEPTRLAPRVTPARHASMSMVTEPHELPRSAVVIDMVAWKAERQHRYTRSSVLREAF